MGLYFGQAGSRPFPALFPFHLRCSADSINNTALRNGLKVAGGGIFAGAAVGLAAGAAPRLSRSSTVSQSGQGEASGSLLPPLTVTNGLILANILIYGAQLLSKDAVTVAGLKVNALILKGQWWRLLTAATLHGNIMHLAMNCYSLYNLGPMVERLAGGKRMLAVYGISAFAGNVASFYGSTAPSLGASGAVFGVGGALAMYFVQNKELHGKRADFVLKSLWQNLLINLVYGLANPRIDNWGHIGGMIGGALVTFFLGPRLKVATIEGRRGRYLVDVPPVPLLADKPRPM